MIHENKKVTVSTFGYVRLVWGPRFAEDFISPVLNMNMNLFNHNNSSADDYVQLNSCGC